MNEIATNAVTAAETATNSLGETIAAVNHGSVFNGLDWVIIALFAVGMVITVLFSMRKKNESGKDYFLSGRDANWLQIGTLTICFINPPGYAKRQPLFIQRAFTEIMPV